MKIINSIGKFLVVALILMAPKVSFSYCWSSGGGDGTAWLSGQITAGGSGVADVNVYLQPESWLSGYMYVYESACTDSSGNFYFKNETNPANNCYTTYTYYDTSYTYCNWRSAACYEQCYNDDANGYYSGMSVSLEGYKLVATPSWGSALSESYGNCEVTDIDIDFDGSQTKNCALAEKNIIIRIRVQDGSGNAVTSGLSAYVSGSTYSYKEIDSSFKDVYVSAGTYYVGAYCTYWENCSYACISNTTVTVDDDDVIETVTLTAKANDSTVTGTISGSDGALLGNAYVSIGNYDYSGSSSTACYAYGWDQTDSSGSYSVNLPAGNYTMWVSPPWNGTSGGNYASKQESVTLTADETLTKDVELLVKGANISGSVTDSNGDPISGVWVNIWTYSDEYNDWGSGQTDAVGAFTIGAITGAKYNVQAWYWDNSYNSNESSISNCSSEGMVTAQAPATDVNFTFASLDHTVTFTLVDADGNVVSSVYGGGSIRPSETSTNEYWCGTWVSFDGGSVTKKFKSATSYIIDPYTWGSTAYDPSETSVPFTTGASGESSHVNVSMIPVDATISGNFVDFDDNIITPDSTYISVYASRDTLWRSCQATSSSYTCDVSAGRWCRGYWLDWNSGYASQSGATNCVDVTAGANISSDLTFLRTAYINVTVKNNAGEALRWVWVEASPNSAAVHGANAETRMYWNNGCSTNAEGICTITIGAPSNGMTYYINAYRPWSEMNNENLTLPQEVSVVAVAGETVDASQLTFRVLDGELAITATVADEALANINTNITYANPVINATASLSEDIVTEAYISCFSDMSGYAEATTDASGSATVKCASGDVWHCIGINQLGNNLYISEAAETNCVPLAQGPTAVTIKLNFVATIPDAVSQTWDAGNANTITLSDGFSFSTPASALGDAGNNVSCTVQPDPIMPYQSVSRLTCPYGYDTSCTDAEGSAITQFNSDVTICLPWCGTQAELLGLTSADVRLSYRDTATDSYIYLTNVTVDEESNLVCGKTNHLTEFAIVGNGNLDAVDGDSEDAEEEAERTGEEASGEDTGDGGAAATGAAGCGCQVSAGPLQIELWWWIAITILSFVAIRKRC